MVYNDSLEGNALGALIGFISASGFAFYTVTIRWKPETPKFTTVVFAGIFCAALASNYELRSAIELANEKAAFHVSK